jgi:hypothetical protein
MKAHPNNQSSVYLRKRNYLSLLIKPGKIQAIFHLITIFFLYSCSASTIQEAVTPIHPTAIVLPSPLPTQTPESTATPTPIPDPYRINAGFLERWDGTAYQQIVEASSYHVNDVDNWIIAFDPDGVPITIFEITTQLSVPVVDGMSVVNGVPYRYNAENQTWTAQLFALNGGNVKVWNTDAQKFETYRKANLNEPLTADVLVPLEPGVQLAVDEGKIVASLHEEDIKVEEIGNGVAVRTDGWPVVWEPTAGQLTDYVRIENGLVYTQESTGLKPILAPDGSQVPAAEVRPTSLGYAFVDGSGNLTMLVDRQGNRLPAYNGEILTDTKVYRYQNGELVDAGKVAIEWLIGLPGHETITSTGIGPELTVVIAEKALGIDVNMRWANEPIYRQHWLTNALNRMKDDGYLDSNMTYSQFLEWLEAGNKITLKQLDAIDAATGKPPEGRFNNIEVNKIVVLMTRLNPEGTGEPILPIEGGTRFSAGFSDQFSDDYIFDSKTKTLFAVMELDPGVSLNDITARLAYDVVCGLTPRLRVPAWTFDVDQVSTSRSGRTVYSGKIYHIDNIGRLLTENTPVLVDRVR